MYVQYKTALPYQIPSDTHTTHKLQLLRVSFNLDCNYAVVRRVGAPAHRVILQLH